MPIVTTAVLHFVVVLLIGIVVGLVFNRFGRSWLGRQTVAVTGSETSHTALVGIAGSFIGFHLGRHPWPAADSADALSLRRSRCSGDDLALARQLETLIAASDKCAL